MKISNPPTRVVEVALFATLTLGVARAAEVTMVVADQSWLNANVWSNNAIPSIDNNYSTSVLGSARLRSSPSGGTAGGSADFSGNSLKVIAGTRFLGKQEGSQTASINGGLGRLILDGGRFSFAPNTSWATPIFNASLFEVTGTPGAQLDISASVSKLTINATLSGSGDLLIFYETSANAAGRTVAFNNVDGYTGNLTVSEGLRLDFDSDLTFGGTLSILDTAILNVDRELTFGDGKLIDPINGPVAPGIYKGSGLAALGANYTNAGGTLIVNGTPPDSDGDGLADYYEGAIIAFDPLDQVDGYEDIAGPNDSPLTTDFDGDGRSDAEEFANGVIANQTDPTNPDTDGDGFSDWFEVRLGSDPKDANSRPSGNPVAIVNAGFEDPVVAVATAGIPVSSGLVSGWSVLENDFYVTDGFDFVVAGNPPSASEGVQFATPDRRAPNPDVESVTFVGGDGAAMAMQQDIDVSTFSSVIDQGARTLTLGFDWYDFDEFDEGLVTMRFLNESGVDLGRSATFSSGNLQRRQQWQAGYMAGYPPVGTRTVRLTVSAIRIPQTSGFSRNVHFDGFSAQLFHLDGDSDGMPDDWEIVNRLNPNNPADSGIDADTDTLSNLEEFQYGTNPNSPDTDGDSYRDDVEIAAGSNPLDSTSVPTIAPAGVRVTGIATTKDPGGQVTQVQVTFSGLDPNKRYALKRGVDLITFTDTVDVRQPSASTEAFTDSNPFPAATSGKAFYILVDAP